jgi:CPA2 family monovalent cation:H+ antiporter-2
MGELDLVQDLAVVTFFAGIGGFLCQKIGLSSIVGFLLAGLLIGPHTPPFSIVMHEDRIEALSQLGLVFLMFSIGLDLSVGKLKRMGWALSWRSLSAAFWFSISSDQFAHSLELVPRKAFLWQGCWWPRVQLLSERFCRRAD